MMTTWKLSWNAYDGGARTETSEPTWPEIMTVLDRFRSRYGSASLNTGRRTGGPNDLTLRSDRGNYLLMLGEDVGDDYEVRTLTNEEASGERVDVLGDLWDPKMVTSDFDVVIRAFKQFFETGDVSHDLMS